jgi:hypothetical protein
VFIFWCKPYLIFERHFQLYIKNPFWSAGWRWLYKEAEACGLLIIFHLYNIVCVRLKTYTHFINPSLIYTAAHRTLSNVHNLLMFTSYTNRQTDRQTDRQTGIHSTKSSRLFVLCYFILDSRDYPLQTSVLFSTFPRNHIWMSNSIMFIYILQAVFCKQRRRNWVYWII